MFTFGGWSRGHGDFNVHVFHISVLFTQVGDGDFSGDVLVVIVGRGPPLELELPFVEKDELGLAVVGTGLALAFLNAFNGDIASQGLVLKNAIM